ncbi:MAG: HAD family hydrolase, partial [Acidobacteriota bacterium]
MLGNVRVHDDWDAYRHVTDGGILRQILRENGVKAPELAFDAVKSRFIALVEGHLEYEPCRPIRGAGDALRNLMASEGWQLGIATGGWRRTAVAKLKSAGLFIAEVPLFSSDEAEDREEIMRSCLDALPTASRTVTYIGDGPWDLRASTRLGWDFIAVGPRLEGMHEPWIRDFGDFDPRSLAGVLTDGEKAAPPRAPLGVL